ncbi:MAG: hypothetical protein HRT35_29410 [Algicola sp.]|nr:hypothetical protein [Algicola sp.]
MNKNSYLSKVRSSRLIKAMTAPPPPGTRLTTCLMILYLLIILVPLLLRKFLPGGLENPLVLYAFFIASALLFPILLARTLSELFLLPSKQSVLWANVVSLLILFALSWKLLFSIFYSMGRISYINELSISITDSKKGIVIKGLHNAKTEQARAMFASMSFRNYGALVPYRLDSGEYTFITPTEKQQAKYAKLETDAHTIRAIQSKIATNSINIRANIEVYFGLLFTIFMLLMAYQTKKQPWKKYHRFVIELPPDSQKKQSIVILSLIAMSLILMVIDQFVDDGVEQWPVLTALAITVGLGLAQSLAYHLTYNKKTLKTLLAPGVLLGILCFGVTDFANKTYELNVHNHKYGRPFDYVQIGKDLTAITQASSEQKRQQGASAVYRRFGEGITYKQGNGEYVMYQPNREDEKAFEQLKVHQQEIKRLYKRSQDLGKVLYHQLMTKLYGTLLVFLAGLVYWRRRFYPRTNSPILRSS